MAPKDSRIAQEIEATAGFYGPSMYAGLEQGLGTLQGLLSHFHDLSLAPDADGWLYFPMTAVKFNSRDTKLFAVGVLPPSAQVTGKILDRSASVVKVTGISGAETDVAGESTGNITPAVEDVNAKDAPDPEKATSKGWHQSARKIIIEAFRKVMGRDPSIAEMQYCQAVGFNESGYGTAKFGGEVLNNWGAVQCYKEGPDCHYWEDSHPSGQKYPVGFRRYETPVDGAADMIRLIMKRKRTAAALASEGTVFDVSYAMRRELYYEENCPRAAVQYGASSVNKSTSTPDLNEATKACAQEAITRNTTKLKRTIDAIAPSCGDPWAMALGDYGATDAAWHGQTGGGSVGSDAGSSKGWSKEGSKDAKTAQKERSKVSGTPLNQTKFGQKLQAAQRQAIAEAQIVLEGMRRVPPLRLLVNPMQFAVKGSKIVSDGNWSRRGPIIEHWGDQQDVISASGKVAGFYTLQTGLTRAARQFSESWRNFQSLYLLYKNNGGAYLQDPFDPNGRDRRLTYVGSIYIYYDNILYIGSFSSFNITEDQQTPHTVDYNFEFQVRAAFLLDVPDDRYNISYSYGTTDADNPKAQLPGQSGSAEPTPPEMTVGSHKIDTEEEMRKLKESIAISSEARKEQEAAQEQQRQDDGTKFFEELAKKNANKDKVPSDVQRVVR